MSLKEKLKEGAMVAVLGLASAGFISGLIEQGKYERTRREVQLVIDSNKNRIIIPEEWKPVYESLGVKPHKYNCLNTSLTSYGLDLTRKQLEEYLAKTR